MHDALASLGQGATPERLTSFEALREVVGFDAYDAALTELDKKSGA